MEDDIKTIKEKDAKDIYAAIKETKIENSLKGKMLYLTVLKNEMNSIQAKYGTFANLPPEIIKNEEYTHNIDIWNLGIIGFFMLYKKHPFNSIKKKELEKKIINEEIVFDKSNEVNKNLVMIVERCLERNKYIRPDSDELIKYIDYL